MINLLIKYKKYKNPLQEVADGMKISKQAVKNMLYRIREGYVSRMKYVDWYREKRQELNTPGKFM